jgi:hypothetical protein
MAIQRATQHSLESTNLADLLERLLDKGIVIAGDIKISLVEVELLPSRSAWSSARGQSQESWAWTGG